MDFKTINETAHEISLALILDSEDESQRAEQVIQEILSSKFVNGTTKIRAAATNVEDVLRESLRFARHLSGCDWAPRALSGGKSCSCGYLNWRNQRDAALHLINHG